MTYCLGLRVDEGLVLLSDTRTNAGVDNVARYRKMFVWENGGERVIVMLTAGNLSVTQSLAAHIQKDIEDPDATPATSIMLAPSMLAAVEIIGERMSAIAADVSARMARMNQMAGASLLVGGQRRGGAPRLFLVYAEGNAIEATEDTPYLQIGEHKYGKPILDRVITHATPLADARKAALLSMDSTLRSNLSVGMPLDLATIRAGECRVGALERIEDGDPGFTAMSQAWSVALRDAFTAIPG